MQNRHLQQLKFNRWHERQLFLSFSWLVSRLLCGFHQWVIGESKSQQ